MIEAGDADGCEAFLALHCDPLIPLGKIGYRRGHLNAAVDTVRITVRGKGGHGSRPHLCVDPVRIGSLLVTELHHLVGREVSAHDPTVLTITTFHAGDAANIIAETALLQGTLRSYDDTARKAMKEGIRRVCKGLGQAHRAGIDVEMGDGHPSVRNDDGLVSLLEESITETLGKDAHHVMPVPTLGGDDFAYFGRKGPQLLYRLGVRVDAKAPPEDLHSPRFVVPPEALEIGARVMEELARRVARG
jgi:amidohydrolase